MTDKFKQYVIGDIFRKSYKYKNKNGSYSVIFPFFFLSYDLGVIQEIRLTSVSNTSSFFHSAFRNYVIELYGTHREDSYVLCDSFIKYLKENISLISEEEYSVLSMRI